MSQYDAFLQSDGEEESSEMEFESDTNNETSKILSSDPMNEISEINDLIATGQSALARSRLYPLIQVQQGDLQLWLLLLRCWSQEINVSLRTDKIIETIEIGNDLDQFILSVQRGSMKNIYLDDILKIIELLLSSLDKYFIFMIPQEVENVKLLTVAHLSVIMINKLHQLGAHFPNILPILQIKLYYMRQWEIVLSNDSEIPYYLITRDDIVKFINENDMSNVKIDDLLLTKIKFFLQCFLFRYFQHREPINEGKHIICILNILQDSFKKSLLLQHDLSLMYMFDLSCSIVLLPTEYDNSIWSRLVQVKSHILSSLETSRQLNVDQDGTALINMWSMFVFVTICSTLTVYQIDTVTPTEYESLKMTPESSFMQSMNELYDEYIKLNLPSLAPILTQLAHCHVLIPQYVQLWLLMGQWYYFTSRIIPMYDCISTEDIDKKLSFPSPWHSTFASKTQLMRSTLGNAPFVIRYEIDFVQDMVYFSGNPVMRSRSLEQHLQRNQLGEVPPDTSVSHYTDPILSGTPPPEGVSLAVYKFVHNVSI